MDKRSWLFVKKYIYSGKKGWFKTDTMITVSGLIISVAILTTVLSIFTGYQKLLRKTILGVNSHIYIFSMHSDLLDKRQIKKVTEFLKKQPEVKSYSLLINKEVLVSNKDRLKAALVRGIDFEETNIEKNIIKGGKKPSKNEVIIGYRLAEYLNLKVGDKININSPDSKMFSVFGIQNKNDIYIIGGLYRSGMYEYDSSFIFMDRLKSDFFENKDKYTLVEVKLLDKFISKASYLAYKWQNLLSNEYQINSWVDYNGNLFSLLTLEKWVIFIIISFLVLISSFNIISSISTSIIREKKNIGILKTMGVTDGLLKQIFLFRTLFVSLIAIITGELIGVILTYIATKQNFFTLKGDVYFIDKITADYGINNFLIIVIVSLTIITLASILPLKRISALKIIDILRS